MDYRFEVLILERAKNFIDGLDQKARKKVLYNIWKARFTSDQNLFKKLREEIWEFRTYYNGTWIRLFAFWDKRDKKKTLVIVSHGFFKKTGRTPNTEIKKCENIRKKYLTENRE